LPYNSKKIDWDLIDESEENLKRALYKCDIGAFQEARDVYIESLAQPLANDIKESLIERLAIYEKVAQEITSEDGIKGVQDRIKGYSEKLQAHRRSLTFLDDVYESTEFIVNKLDGLGYDSQRYTLIRHLDELKAIKDDITRGYEL